MGYNDNCLVEKTRESAGADERTPSRAQYFSWINNTNEGSSERQTLINFDYFRWLRDEYGMQLDIYAWDAGNLDGASGTYEKLDSPKLVEQYPNGYEAVGREAKKLGFKLGVWCGPDGFGDTPEEEAARHELMVSLCRDHNFGLFKMDGVCGNLREEKQDAFVRMMEECRRYSPELILLNHRLNLGKGLKYATTFLWNGAETYMDVHVKNEACAPHHRQFMFTRGNVDGLLRLTEDHGVCISSCCEYFDHELIYQAFGRSLILAPEIYGNPWLLRDDEQAKLARIYNLHRLYRDILVDGVELPSHYGASAVARGDGKRRFITTGNPKWNTMDVNINLNGEIGLERTDEDIVVSVHFPYEKYIGTYRYGDTVKVKVRPFNACLIEISAKSVAYPMLTGCTYEVLHEKDGVPTEIKIIAVDGKLGEAGLSLPAGLENVEDFDNTVVAPIELTREFERRELPENIEQLCETALFAVNNDSFEARERDRAGESRIPEVRAAREAFFEQVRYKLRGCESSFAFDGNDDTYFGASRHPYGRDLALGGGGLRVDFGAVYNADYVVIEYFDIGHDIIEAIRVRPAFEGDTSTDLSDWRVSALDELELVRRETRELPVNRVHNLKKVDGTRRRAYYTVDGGKIRYFRAPGIYSYMFKIALYKDGHEVKLTTKAKASNLLPTYTDRPAVGYRTTEIDVPADAKKSAFIAVGLNGEHGKEGFYAMAEVDGKLYGCPDRAPSYLVNPWECPSRTGEAYNTYYLPVADEMRGKKIRIHAIEMTKQCKEWPIIAWLCEANTERKGIVAML